MLSRLIVLLMLASTPFLSVEAQTYSVRLGSSKIGGDSPVAGTFTFLAGESGCGTSSYTTISQAPLVSTAPSFSSVTGVQRGIVCLEGLQLFATGQGGVASSADATAGLFKGGGGVIWRPTWAKGAGFVITGEAVTSPLTEGWRPQVGLGLQFDFSGKP